MPFIDPACPALLHRADKDSTCPIVPVSSALSGVMCSHGRFLASHPLMVSTELRSYGGRRYPSTHVQVPKYLPEASPHVPPCPKAVMCMNYAFRMNFETSTFIQTVI